jgi:hypothetical protein
MLKFLKSLFGKNKETSEQVAPYKVEAPAQPVSEVKVDPVSVALDLEPVMVAVESNKTPKKPRTPAKKPSTKKAPLATKSTSGRGRKPKAK